MPGGGGTQRLPRLAGPSEALKMMLTGAHVPAKKALDMGIVDGISEDVVNESIEFIKNKAESNEEHPKVRDLNSKMIEARGDDKVLLEAQAMASKGRKGQFAPGQIIKCVEAAINIDDFDEALLLEVVALEELSFDAFEDIDLEPILDEVIDDIDIETLEELL